MKYQLLFLAAIVVGIAVAQPFFRPPGGGGGGGIGNTPIPTPNPPRECSTGNLRQAYNSAWRQAFDFIRLLFTSRSNCGNFESFISVLTVPFPNRPTDQFNQCSRRGYRDGIQAARQYISAFCFNQCVGTGADIGENQGRIYCGVTTFAAQTSDNLCQTFNELGCRTAFNNYVDRNCPDKKRRDPNFGAILNAGCRSRS